MDFLRADEKKGVAKHETEKSTAESLGKTGAGVYDVRPDRLSDMDSRSEPLGYINEVRRTDGDHVAHRSDIVQREPAPAPTPVDKLIKAMSAEKEEELSRVKFYERGVDASVSEKKVGSLYFPNGRFRLTHWNGPQIDVMDEQQGYTIRRFADEQNVIAKMIINGEIPEGMEQITALKRLEDRDVKPIPDGSFPKGALIELFFKDGVLIGNHESRGELEERKLKKENSNDTQQSLAMEIGEVVAASQMLGEYIKTIMVDKNVNAKNVDPLAIYRIFRRLFKEKIGLEKNEDIPSELASLVDEGNLETAIWVASQEAELTTNEQYTTAFIERIQGYFANQLFLMSGIADRMNIPVDRTDQWPKE